MINLTVGNLRFSARLEEKLAPATVSAFEQLLPFRGLVIQSRWSGEAAWIPLEEDLDIPDENATSYPAPGQILLYPGGPSVPELLWAYGTTRFMSKVGQLAGNHFATVDRGLDLLNELGRMVAREGQQPVTIEQG